MVVDVRAGEEVETGHAGLIEAGHVGRLVGILLQQQIEPGRDVRLFDETSPGRARAGRLDGELVVLHAPDHVEVQVRRELIERHRGLFTYAVDPSRPSSSPDQNSSSTLRLRGARREHLADGEHGG